jgi:hypothetical protein
MVRCGELPRGAKPTRDEFCTFGAMCGHIRALEKLLAGKDFLDYRSPVEAWLRFLEVNLW